MNLKLIDDLITTLICNYCKKAPTKHKFRQKGERISNGNYPMNLQGIWHISVRYFKTLFLPMSRKKAIIMLNFNFTLLG